MVPFIEILLILDSDAVGHHVKHIVTECLRANPVTNSDTTNNSNRASAPNFTPSIPNVWSTKFEKPIDCAYIAYRYSPGTFVELLNSDGNGTKQLHYLILVAMLFMLNVKLWQN